MRVKQLTGGNTHLTDSLSNPTEAVARLVVALGERGGTENVQVNGDTQDAIVAQAGMTDAPGRVRLHVKENRKLSPAEVVELVDAYKAGASQTELSRRFGLHEQTVRAHLRRQSVRFRPLRALTEPQEVEVVRLYVEEVWSLLSWRRSQGGTNGGS